MTVLRVTPAQLGEFAQSQIRGAYAGQVQTLLDGLKGQIEAELAQWSGEGASSFEGLFTDWNAKAQAMQEAILAIADAVSEAASRYSQTDSAAAAVFV